MSNTGKIMRMRRLLDPETGTTFMFAISHGTSAPMVLKGLEKAREMVSFALEGGANTVFLSRGYAEHLSNVFAKFPKAALTLKVSSSASTAAVPYQEVQ